MRRNTTMMGLVYFGLAAVFIYFAILNVNNQSWNFWTFLFAGFAALDILIGLRFLRAGKQSGSGS
ncbi:YdiK family protein [Salibacterium halotolerans]|uniref:DUF4305 domain-containing protein n=1 Tax=Salibacterium halotolerans TaxID=1884432 RepID=A0A1I5P9A6_9BACI|nr:YdiK family protein [Salibacterium halotolerans]SFP30370.1 protein of unknown function [Salibacterium halotolerans]